MLFSNRVVLGFALGAGLLMLCGCGEDTASRAPEPLAVEQAPTTLEQAFASAGGDLKLMADEAIQFLRNGDYPRALVALQKLTSRTDLDGHQRGLASQALLTANQKVAEAAEKGNAEAEKLLRYRSANK
ncbi:MAG TPA: hypothetical protein DCY13_01380 [Verrucomicrobiales bacterium]|nr:hypothetical protein [Verrucomicrobiales bacterium]